MSFEKRKAVPLAAAFLIAVGIGSTATADTGVEIYSTNVTLNGGDIGLGGGDIRDSGVVVWNSSQGYVPAASVETNPIQSGTTASDVGLGQVENEAQVAESGDTLSGSLNLGGNDLTSSGTTVWDSTNGFVPASSVEVNPIQSGTTSSDVGLGQVENEAQVAESGDNLTGDLNLTGNTITNVGSPVDGDDVISKSFFQSNEKFIQNTKPTDNLNINDQDLENVNLIQSGLAGTGDKIIFGTPNSGLTLRSESGPLKLDGGLKNIEAETEQDIVFKTDTGFDDGGPYEFRFEDSDGSFSADGTKNWIHDLNKTYESVYTSQESPEVRAVYEGQAATSNGQVNVSLPSHFSKTVSDTRPSLRVQVTPHSLASVAVTERTDDYLVVESSKDVTVDYRVTGIREGYEDKQVVRKK